MTLKELFQERPTFAQKRTKDGTHYIVYWPKIQAKPEGWYYKKRDRNPYPFIPKLTDEGYEFYQ
jgi:hypothetical protein